MQINLLKCGIRCLSKKTVLLLLVIFLQMFHAADGVGVVDIDPSAFVSAHNKYRCLHGSPNLVWSDSLAAKALSWAKTCSFDVDLPDGTGLYSSSKQPAADRVVGAWYNKYSGDEDFARVVWTNISQVGCAMCLESEDWYDVVCFYDQQVNVDDSNSFQANVPPVSHTAVECQERSPSLPSSNPRFTGTAGGSIPSLVPASPTKLPNGVTILPLEPLAYINAHNALRCKHGTPGLAWSNTLAASALEWAKTCLMEHTNGSYGENLSTNPTTTAADRVVKRWYNEIAKYDYNKPAFSDLVGHFTQMIWKGTQQVGCAMCSPNGRRQTVMCMYDPPGNSGGLFSFLDNVLPVIPNAECAGNTSNASVATSTGTASETSSANNSSVPQTTSAAANSLATQPLSLSSTDGTPATSANFSTATVPTINMLMTTGVNAAARRLPLISDEFQTGVGHSDGGSSQWSTHLFQDLNPVTSAAVVMSVILILAAAVLTGWHALHCYRFRGTNACSQTEMSSAAVLDDGSPV